MSAVDGVLFLKDALMAMEILLFVKDSPLSLSQVRAQSNAEFGNLKMKIIS
jgi:hypothetical protein